MEESRPTRQVGLKRLNRKDREDLEAGDVEFGRFSIAGLDTSGWE